MEGANDPPAPPASIPEHLREDLEGRDPETLRAIAAYAEALADHGAASIEGEDEARSVEDPADPPEGWEADDWEATLASADAPPKATLTVKTINDNDYFYYQWREGDDVKSEYVAPVSPDG